MGRAEIRAPLKTPAREAGVLLAVLPLSLTLLIKKIIFPPYGHVSVLALVSISILRTDSLFVLLGNDEKRKSRMPESRPAFEVAEAQMPDYLVKLVSRVRVQYIRLLIETLDSKTSTTTSARFSKY